ncbi:MAG: putative transport system permease protein [Actinomycetota bacterium]|nr:putative transport system permease protein [Actinomycetota bacterium]
MFQRGYLLQELRRRWGRTLVTALGLAVGVGLVLGIIGLSQGLSEAQTAVLQPLSSIGTDILVTRVATSTATSNNNTQNNGGGGFFANGANGPNGGGGGGAAVSVNGANASDANALLAENSNVTTDLSKLGPAGTKFTHDFFLSSTLLSFPADALTATVTVPGVASATAGLTQLVEHQTGTVPTQTATFVTGGETLTTTATPAPLTDAEQTAVQTCLQSSGVRIGDRGQATATVTPKVGGAPAPAPSGAPDTGLRIGRGGGAFQACLPVRFQQYTASITTARRSINQAVNPPSTDISTTSYTAAGIDPGSPTSGLVTTSQLVAGRWIGNGAGNEVLLNQSYASQHSYNVGSQLPINGTSYTVVGLVKPTLTGTIADVYFPLSTIQTLAGKSGRITQILVKVKDASQVDAVAKRIQTELPGATVITTQSLANQVTGSLKDVKKLADSLGGALGVIVVAAAFVIAMLLTLSSVGKRVREIGTLRAIGWSRGRVVRQIVAETVGIGLVAGALGIALGFGASAAVTAFSPTLSANTVGVSTFQGSSLAGLFGQSTQAVTTTSTIHLTAPIHPLTLIVGVALAVLGGLIAGGVGAARAARLSPSEALRNLA